MNDLKAPPHSVKAYISYLQSIQEWEVEEIVPENYKMVMHADKNLDGVPFGS